MELTKTKTSMGAGKIIFGAGIAAGIVWLISYLAGKKKVGDKLETLTTAMIHSLNLTGLTLRINVTLKNPTEGTLTIRHPYVRILFEETVVGTSQLKDTSIEIPKYGVKVLDPIYITVPATGLLTIGNSLFKYLMKKQPAKIKTIIITSIKVGGTFINYEKADLITLTPKK